jgi:glycine C-acetyltransferase
MIPVPLATAAAQTEPRTSGVVAEAIAPGQVTVDGRGLVNLASCDYLGFAHDTRIVHAARQALAQWGLGTASTRALSGTTVVHRELESQLADWVGCQDAVLHGSCWAANAAIFGSLATLASTVEASLVIYSDTLNHASIIDALRTQRRSISALHTYQHDDLERLRSLLEQKPLHDRHVIGIIVTDGVFSMEGNQAPLAELVHLAQHFEVLLVVDDSHGTGVAGDTGRGTAQAQGLLGDIDVITGTLGKALGGASGGFVAGTDELMSALRAVSRPYTFSNNPPTLVAATTLAAIALLRAGEAPLPTLRDRVAQLRDGIEELGLATPPGQHPIIPIILGDEDQTQHLSHAFSKHGLLATPLTFPIVPRGGARLRLQVSAAHTPEAINRVLDTLRATTTTHDRPVAASNQVEERCT